MVADVARTRHPNAWQWDFFLAHSSLDAATAEQLYDHLSERSRVFLDSRSLLPGDDWDLALRRAQTSSRVSVVLVSANTDQAYYQREEVATAIDLARDETAAHRVIPVFLSKYVGDVPYGLRLKQGIHAEAVGGIPGVADQLLNLMTLLQHTPAPTSSPPTNAGPSLSASAAEEEGIFLIRLINPPGKDDKPEVTTGWIGAKGQKTYIVDSVTITHWRGNLYGRVPVTGAQSLDAEYSFEYEEGKSSTSALNPALVLESRDRREVSFNLRLTPGRILCGAGSVHARLGYHTSDGESGGLVLEAPPRAVWLLARMLKTDVCTGNYEFPYVVTPEGLQRGAQLDGEEHYSGVTYSPGEFDYFPLQKWDLDKADEIAATRRKPGPIRQKLIRALESGNHASEVVRLVQTGEKLGFDLASEWLEPSLDDALRRSVIEGSRPLDAIAALALRHVLAPGPLLADLILDPITQSRLPSVSKVADPLLSITLEHAALALAAFPQGKWASAILSLAARESFFDIFELVNARRSRLSDEELGIADEFCRQHVSTTSQPNEHVLNYLSWRRISYGSTESQ